jgi:pimeloyl-ACP methyl ester carboxylesterase
MRAFTDKYTIVLVTEMITDPVSTKRTASLGPGSVAYIDEGSGPPVLLLHGCPFWSDVWGKTIVHLRPHFRCIAPDLLGLGDTETPLNADWTLPAQAAIVLELLDRLGLRRVHVVGHDHGGAIAQILAAKHPEVVDSDQRGGVRQLAIGRRAPLHRRDAASADRTVRTLAVVISPNGEDRAARRRCRNFYAIPRHRQPDNWASVLSMRLLHCHNPGTRGPRHDGEVRWSDARAGVVTA